MKISQVLALAPTLYDKGISVHFQSSPGVGKSDMVEKDIPRVLSEHLGVERFGSHTRNLTSFEAPDVRGFCIPVKGDDGTMRARFTQSPLIPEADDPEHGIVFLDEFSQASSDVQKPAADFKLHGRAGESQLPPGWRVWSAGNRMSDRAGVVKPLSHVTNRHIVIDLEFNLDDWIKWAFNKGIDPLFIAFAKYKPGMLCQDVPKEPVPFCTPRSFSELADLTNIYTGGNINEAMSSDPVMLELACGMIGKAAAVEAMAFMKVAADLPTWSSIVNTPDVAAQALPKGRMDVMHSCTSLVVHNVDAESIDPVFTFVEHLPKEFQTATIRQMLDKLGGVALNNTKFATWMSNNSALVRSSFS